ncbi:MAG: hypothetical protein ABJA74_01745 [Lapillicoccus sp.]
MHRRDRAQVLTALEQLAYTCNGGWSTNSSLFNTASTWARSASVSRFAGTTGAGAGPAAGGVLARAAVARGTPVSQAAARVLTPAVLRSP